MKKTDFFLIGGTLLYAYLFYHQAAGINFFLFTLALFIFLLFRNPSLVKSFTWPAAGAGALLSGACVLWHGSLLSVIANVISLSALAGLSIAPQSSFILSIFFSAYSYISAPAFMALDAYTRQQNRVKKENPSERRLVRLMTLGVAPVAVVLTFLLLYRAANPVFDLYVSKIKLDFISLQFIFFTLGGLVLLYGFFYHRKIDLIAEADTKAGNTLHDSGNWFQDKVRQYLNLPLEYKSGIILFGLLNLLLLSVNILDVIFLYLEHTLPIGLTHSQFLHQGVWSLIISVILAAAIILFYFRGELNFHKENKVLKILTYLWIAQNIFMVCSTAWRNGLYIESDDLTYKRIGVYFYLGLTVIGLLFTTVKVAQKKTNWYLFRANSWAFYTVLILSCFVNWPALVAQYNISSAIRHNEPVYQAYLRSLSFHTLPYLAEYQQKVPATRWDAMALQNRAGLFLDHDEKLGWQSWSYDRWQTRKKLEAYKSTIEQPIAPINTLTENQ